MFRNTISAVVVFISTTAAGFCADVPITDIRMPDPEFDSVRRRVAWQDSDGTGQQLWVADVDPFTGAIQSPQIIDTAIVPLAWTKNGPEWASNAEGSMIIYAGRDADNIVVLKRAWESAPGVWLNEELLNTGYMRSHRLAPIGTMDGGAVFPVKILYLGIVRGKAYRAWREIDDPASEEQVPEHLGFGSFFQGTGRWACNRESFISNALDAEGVLQTVEYNVRTGATSWLTSGPKVKGDSFMWGSPEHEGRYMFFTTVEVPGVPWRGLEVYLENAEGGWDLIHQIYPPVPPPMGALSYINSPEPFLFEGRSYISYSVSDEPKTGESTSSEIWIAGADPAVLSPLRVSDASPAVRRDPEAFIGADTVWIYYNLVGGRSRELRLCDTGL